MENLLDKINHVVIKVGSKAITTNHSINTNAISNIADSCYKLLCANKKVSIVTSGAIAAGRRATNHWNANSLAEKQMLAAIGQPILMQEYIRIFEKYNIHVPQFLLSKFDFEDPSAFKRLEASFNVNFGTPIIRIINENDPVETHEIKFSDNDELQSLIVNRLAGDIGVNLITYPGLLRAGAIVRVGNSYNASDYDNLSKEVKEGRGGLQGKLDSMKKMQIEGKYGIIGNVMGNIFGMIEGKSEHTRFYPISN